MPKAFHTNTINEANAGAVGLATVEDLRDHIVAHAAWELVEEFTPASGLVHWYVFRNLASVSLLPRDWYVVIGRTIGSGRLVMFLCETYDSGTKTVGGYAPYTASPQNNVVFDAFGRGPWTYVLGTAELGTSVTNAPQNLRFDPTGTANKYWLIVDDDWLAFAFNGAWNGIYTFGRFNWLSQDVPNDCPLIMWGSTGSTSPGNTYNNGITNNPLAASQTRPAYAITYLTASSVVLGFSGRLDTGDALLNGERPVAELGIVMNNISTASGQAYDAATIGYILGKYRNTRFGVNPPSGVAFGDAYVIDGTLWVPWSPSLGYLYDTGIVA